MEESGEYGSMAAKMRDCVISRDAHIHKEINTHQDRRGRMFIHIAQEIYRLVTAHFAILHSAS